MKGRFLLGSNEDPAESNIYADKSALILDWLLREGLHRQRFSLREVATVIGVSVGLVHRVFDSLVLDGFLKTEGIRTAKRFFCKSPRLLLKSWLDHYSIVKKCKMRTYCSVFSEKEELLNALKKSKVAYKVALALHSAAEAYGCKNTNLNTLELYMLDLSIRSQLEEILQLEAQERGYKVLLIEPYYKRLLILNQNTGKEIGSSPALLTFLDLYHFPLRGQEQAEFMIGRTPELKFIYKNG